MFRRLLRRLLRVLSIFPRSVLDFGYLNSTAVTIHPFILSQYWDISFSLLLTFHLRRLFISSFVKMSLLCLSSLMLQEMWELHSI